MNNMWDNEEDNNPFGFPEADDSTASSDHIEPLEIDFNAKYEPIISPDTHTATPGITFKSFVPTLTQISSNIPNETQFSETNQSSTMQPRRGDYESRIEQIICGDPSQPILIVNAGKNLESGGSYIVYTIRTGDLEVRRRYSEFASLRLTLVNLHPTLIIPPIPEKHSVADYATKPTKAKEDIAIIELRKRMLAVFLNRCKNHPEIRGDGVWWRFLDPNASWSEVIRAHPVSSLPRNILLSPPLDATNPTEAHLFLPIPITVTSHKTYANIHAGIDFSSLVRFPPGNQKLSEEDLDPYFQNFEILSKELEAILQGSLKKTCRKLLSHYSLLADDLAEFGARYNALALSEQSQNLALAIEKIGQAVDGSYVATRVLRSQLSETFVEPMREYAQFSGVVCNVLRYRLLKRVQQDMTKMELEKKRLFLQSLERSEMEAQRIEQYLDNIEPGGALKNASNGSGARSSCLSNTKHFKSNVQDRDERMNEADGKKVMNSGDTATNSTHMMKSTLSENSEQTLPLLTGSNKATAAKNFVTNKIFGRINHALQGIVDTDPEKHRRDHIGKTQESIYNLERALKVSEKDVRDASFGVLNDLKRFQREKEDDIRQYMIAFAKCHIEWARKSLISWEEAKVEIENIEVRRMS